MRKEFGKWLMDIAKYIITAVVISSVFGEAATWVVYVGGCVSAVVALLWGLYLVSGKTVRKDYDKKFKNQ